MAASRRGNVSFEVEMEIRGLAEGDIIEISNGEHHEVIRVKRVNIETKHNDQCFNVPLTMYRKVIKKKTKDEKNKELDLKREEYKTLKPGEPFYFVSNGVKEAVLLYFMHLEPGKIVGKSPVGDRTWRIDEAMYGGKVKMPAFTK
ncbi:hypothetical protein D3C81_333630 [compost metagenome]